MKRHTNPPGDKARRKVSYLYVFPADRENGWLCDGNAYWGKEINWWNAHLRMAEAKQKERAPRLPGAPFTTTQDRSQSFL